MGAWRIVPILIGFLPACAVESSPIGESRPDGGPLAMDGAVQGDAGPGKKPPDKKQPDKKSSADDAALLDAAPSIDAGAIPSDSGAPPLDAQIPDANSCEPWTSTIELGPDVPCEQEPPPDVGPFGYRVALTFDDGPGPQTTPDILAALRQEAVPATFFIVGRRFMQSPVEATALTLSIHHDALFRAANHTFTHARLPELDPAATIAEIEDTNTALRSAVGDPCYFPRFLRFPYGDSDCNTMRLVRERGLSVVGVHIDSSDWCYGGGGGYCSPEAVPWMRDEHRSDPVAHVLAQLDRYQGGIVLMHDVQQVTADFLPRLITALRDAGVTFVALDDAEVFPLLNAQAQPPAPPACCGGVVR